MISVTILVKNGGRYLQQVLEATKAFSEVLVLDTGSEDDSLEIAARYPNVVIHKTKFIGFGPCHNMASDLASSNWILSIDSDEVLSPELSREILGETLDPKCVYLLSRHNYYRNKFIRGCGWYPDYVPRLYNKLETRFTDVLVHEQVITTGLQTKKLKGALNHYPYNSIDDFINKMQHYSTLFAKQNHNKKKSSLIRAISHGLFAFFKSYILKLGIFLGSQGFEISAYNGITAYYKYLKLRDLNSQ